MTGTLRRFGAVILSAAVLGTGCRSAREATGDAVALIPQPTWELVWSDEFDGDTLDRGSWNVPVVADPHNNELQYYPGRVDDEPSSNIWIEDGLLVIEARREDYEHRKYTSGRINTRGTREFLYGRFEARIRQPGEVGMWPAFWLLGGNIGEVGWPACGEIDILEGKGRLSDWTSGALHAGTEPSTNYVRSFEHEIAGGSFHDSWHTFAVEWEPLEIRWYVDGEFVHSFSKPPDTDPAYWPFDHGHPFFIILNLAVGGWFDEGHPPPEEMEPQRLFVDWVRVYSAARGAGH